MTPLPVILIFDVGKTNKKLLLFDEQYRLVLEQSDQLPQTADEDGDECEDILLLSGWIKNAFDSLTANLDYDIKAVNFSAYGASFVHLGDDHRPVTPLYNYLKAYPEALKRQFYNSYGGEVNISMQTASPVLGSLNSGMQLYRLKYEKPEIFLRIRYSLHLPQYLSYLISGEVYSDITSIGCHTGLWDFMQNDYHYWVYNEGIDHKLAPVNNANEVVYLQHGGKQIPVGMGLHDSSAALIPYLAGFQEPFILLSTGTWCISMNPFNHAPLTTDELKKDCLCYLTYEGKPVKASRLFAGYEHEAQTKRLAAHFKTRLDYYKTVEFDKRLSHSLSGVHLPPEEEITALLQASLFGARDLSLFPAYEAAYHQFIADLVTQQLASTELIMKNSVVKRIFVDGGFSKNPIYMHLLAKAFPHVEVFAASVAQATATGAALAIHQHWNTKPLPGDIIGLKYYSVTHDNVL